MNDRIFVFDTTLRDGERSPGSGLSLEEKLKMARQLESLQVDVIEAGSPMVSPADFEGVRLVAKTIEVCTVAARCRAQKAEINRTWEAIQYAKKPRIHTYIRTSGFKPSGSSSTKSREQILEEAVSAVGYAKSLCSDVEFTCKDATRTDIDFLAQMVTAVIGAGASVVTLPDTVGYATPSEYGALFSAIRERVPTLGRTVLSAHSHDDLGLAVANSLAALQNGARQVECTVNGIGERAGSASLEEIVMLLRARREFISMYTNVNPEEIYKSSKLLSNLTGMLVQRNKPVVGANAFAQQPRSEPESTSQDGLKYETISPQSVGIRHSTHILGKHSDRDALHRRYSELGYVFSPEELERAFQYFRQLAEKKKEIFDEDLIAILEEKVEDSDEIYHLENIQVHSGTNIRPTATVELRRGDQRLVDSATGDGPVDAAYKAIERVTGLAGQLTEYSIKSVSLGRDAIGEVFIRVNVEGVLFNGRGLSTDIIAGSAKAYLEALNRSISARERKTQDRKEGSRESVPTP